jgi:hypothetical protein
MQPFNADKAAGKLPGHSASEQQAVKVILGTHFLRYIF